MQNRWQWILLKAFLDRFRLTMFLDTFIAGIPCTVELKYEPPCRGYREPGGRQLEPDMPASFEIVNVFKSGGFGKHMDWLEDKMSEDDNERIIDEAKRRWDEYTGQ